MKLLTLNQVHSEYDASTLEKARALYEGGETWRKLIRVWVPKNTAEPEELWQERKNRAVYVNHAGPVVDLIAAWLFSEAVQVTGLDPEFVSDVGHNCESWGIFWKNLFVEALQGRRAYVWVNLPARPEGVVYASRAEEEAAGLLRPYLVPLCAEEVIDWGRATTGELAWVMIRQKESRRAGPDQPRQTVWRWLYVDSAQIRTWEWISPDGKEPTREDTATEKPVIQHGMGKLPIIPLELPAGLWAMGKLMDPAIALLRGANDLDWALHRGAHALMVIATLDGSINPPKLGAGYYLSVTRDKDGTDTVSYAEPGGQTYTALSERVQDLREELYRVVQAMALSVSGDGARAQSGESKARDWQAMEVILAAYAALVLECMEEVGEQVAGLVGGGEVRVTGLDGWQQETLDVLLAQLKAVLEMVSESPTLTLELHKKVASRALMGASKEAHKQVMLELEAKAKEGAKTVSATPLADTALTGIQIEKLMAIVMNVSSGLLAPAAAEILVIESFPQIPADRAKQLVKDAKEFVPKVQAQPA